MRLEQFIWTLEELSIDEVVTCEYDQDSGTIDLTSCETGGKYVNSGYCGFHSGHTFAVYKEGRTTYVQVDEQRWAVDSPGFKISLSPHFNVPVDGEDGRAFSISNHKSSMTLILDQKPYEPEESIGEHFPRDDDNLVEHICSINDPRPVDIHALSNWQKGLRWSILVLLIIAAIKVS